jgi:hypothetical protein
VTCFEGGEEMVFWVEVEETVGWAGTPILRVVAVGVGVFTATGELF